MVLKDIVDEDFINYKKPSMFLLFPKCSFKCCIEAGCNICQNMDVVKQPDVEIETIRVVARYLSNPITKSVVCGGLEPFDSFDDLYEFISTLRNLYSCDDDIIIYTGYNEDEIGDKINQLKQFKNIIVKFGRFIPNQQSHLDELLGVELASPNQYAVEI